MRIEVAVTKDQTAKAKGDLLEQLAAQLLQIQQYEVNQKVRVTASELVSIRKRHVFAAAVDTKVCGGAAAAPVYEPLVPL